MQPQILANAPRCGARFRSGSPCRSPAIGGNRRWRMHGGKGSGAPRGNRNGWNHGAYSRRMKDISRYIRMTGLVIRQAKMRIWFAQCEARTAKLDQAISRRMPSAGSEIASAKDRMAALGTRVLIDPGRDCHWQSLSHAGGMAYLDQINTPPAEFGIQPHAPGNSVRCSTLLDVRIPSSPLILRSH